MPLQAITIAYLKSYEKKAKEQGLSKSTIGMYVRALRAIVNEAIENELLVKDKSYPFGKKKYKIPTARKVKKALELTDVQNLFYCPLETSSDSEQRSRDYWLFSYFGNGMNPKDIACLKYSNIHDEYIVLERAKTERSLCEDPVLITVYLNKDMKAIIKRWGNEPISPDTYIFPILKNGIEPLSQYTRIQNFVQLTNKYMKRITLRPTRDRKKVNDLRSPSYFFYRFKTFGRQHRVYKRSVRPFKVANNGRKNQSLSSKRPSLPFRISDVADKMPAVVKATVQHK